jgi:hypothetical protein
MTPGAQSYDTQGGIEMKTKTGEIKQRGEVMKGFKYKLDLYKICGIIYLRYNIMKQLKLQFESRENDILLPENIVPQIPGSRFNKKKYMKEYNEKYYKTWIAKNKQRASSYHKKWYIKNKTKILKNSRIWHFKRLYNISIEELEQRKLLQNNQCAICNKSFKNNKDTHLDHNHKTKKIRQILCRGCNYLIGNAREDIHILQSAINYLNKWEE